MIDKKLSALLLPLILCLSTKAVADWPVAIPDNMAAHPSQFTVPMDVLSNDIGKELEVIAVNAWSENGARVFRVGDLGVTYRPPVDYEGEDGFWYVIRDAEGRTNAARVSVNILPASSPMPAPQHDQVQTPMDTPIRIDALKNDLFSYTTISGSPSITQFNERSEQGGTIEKVIVYPDSLSAELREHLRYTPPSGFVGTDSFEYTVKDGVTGVTDNLEQTAKVTIEVLKSPNIAVPFPIGNPDTLDFSCNVYGCITRSINVLKNDKGSNLILKLNSTWSLKGGEVQVAPRRGFPPHLFYRPASGFSGEDKVWYVIEDEYGRKNWSVWTINVTNNL